VQTSGETSEGGASRLRYCARLYELPTVLSEIRSSLKFLRASVTGHPAVILSILHDESEFVCIVLHTSRVESRRGM
jgi:hypothetical protein